MFFHNGLKFCQITLRIWLKPPEKSHEVVEVETHRFVRVAVGLEARDRAG